jgi:hypothetical protein
LFDVSHFQRVDFFQIRQTPTNFMKKVTVYNVDYFITYVGYVPILGLRLQAQDFRLYGTPDKQTSKVFVDPSIIFTDRHPTYLSY